jgi:manganese transport protein
MTEPHELAIRDTDAGPSGWLFTRKDKAERSLSEVHGSIPVPQGMSWARHLLAFSGPGYMVAVGYMDPGNWATDIAGGSKFGYTLLSVIMISNLMAILLQALAARLGIAADRDLAQACSDAFPRPVGIALWLICELAIIACDVAEVIGSAIALQLLFGIPLLYGALITAADVFLLLLLMNKGFRFIEAFVIALIIIIGACFVIEIVLSAPPVAAIFKGFIPTPELATNPELLYIAIGIIGATVMLSTFRNCADPRFRAHADRPPPCHPLGDDRQHRGVDARIIRQRCHSHCGGRGVPCERRDQCAGD